MEAFLKAEGDKIDVLYAHNDDMAIGAIQAIEEFGLKPGKDIIIVSIDAMRGAFEAMIEGKLNCTVECSPLLGPQLFDAVEDLMAGKTLPKRIVTNEGVFPAGRRRKGTPQPEVLDRRPGPARGIQIDTRMSSGPVLPGSARSSATSGHGGSRHFDDDRSRECRTTGKHSWKSRA